MRSLPTLCASLLVVVPLLVVGGPPSAAGPALAASPDAAVQASACTPPATMAATPEETAWRLMVAATCPVNAGKYPYVVWETWIEQSQLYSAGGVTLAGQSRPPRFHMSPLARIMRERAAKRIPRPELLLPQAANEDCNSATWSKRTICEEARLNLSSQEYVASNKLTTLAGQERFVARDTFAFPKPAMEIKADWIKLASCTNPPRGVHVEQVEGSCYALGGFHLISKLVDKWVWATFEPQNDTTNPQRCRVLGCADAFGQSPARTAGKPTQLTPPLAALMAQAKLAPEWRNYRLDGVQTDYLVNGRPSLLGNSIIEGDNAGTPALMKQSSCITCHALSTISAQGQQLSPDFIVGVPTAPPAGYARRDFVWSLGLAK